MLRTIQENSGFSTFFRNPGFPVLLYNYSAKQNAKPTAKFFVGIALEKAC